MSDGPYFQCDVYKIKELDAVRSAIRKLDQLTALRFFAALMIVVHHAVGLFGIKKVGVNFGQGVSFFFVLSGFILCYVYPKLETWDEVKRFWRARVARIWPAYIASFLLALWLIGYELEPKTTAAHLLMVQAWVPVSAYYFSYNAVSWSVSTEFFFYLAFPFILNKWGRTWMIKVALSGMVLVALLAAANLLALPAYGSREVGQEGFLVTQHGLIYINPLARIFEFVVGMCVALVWRKTSEIEWSLPMASAYEFGALALCAAAMVYTNDVAVWSRNTVLGRPTALWLVHSGPVLVFGLLIYVMAQGRGLLSKILAHSSLVLLGEISFASYLIHQILLGYYRQNIAIFPQFSDTMAFLVFLSVLLLCSYLMWVFVEMPARRLIMGQGVLHGSAIMKRSWRDHFALGWRPLIASFALISIVGALFQAKDSMQFIGDEQAEKMTPVSLKGYEKANFESRFILRGLDIQCGEDALDLKIAWQSNVFQRLNLTNAIHLIDQDGNILGQSDYQQPARWLGVSSGDIWVDTVRIPSGQINRDAKSLAIGLYDGSGRLLQVDRGPRDWGGRRLVIPLEACKS